MAHIKRNDKRTKAQQQAELLAIYEETGNVWLSCREAKVPRRTHYNWLKEEAYAKKFQEANVIAREMLEDEANRRAVHGVDEPVYYRGKKVGHVKKYSDTLLIVLLKANNPEKFKERAKFEHTGENGQPIKTETTVKFDAESVRAIADVLENKL